MRLLVIAGFVLSSLAGIPGSSGAATLDFTGAVGAAIAAGTSDTAVYTGNAAFGAVTVTANPKGSDLTQYNGNGLGIDCYGTSIACRLDNGLQIDTGEILKVSFDQSLLVSSVEIRNLKGTTLGIGKFSIHIDEGGAVVGQGFDIAFDSDDASADGKLTLAINHWASSLSFVPNGGFFDAFSLAAINIAAAPGPLPPSPANPIPEPSSVLLMLIGAGIVATQVRKHI
jgi:hypothetical protein